MNLTVFGDVPSKKNSRNIFYAKNRLYNLPSNRYEKWHTTALKSIRGHKLVKDIGQVILTFFPSTRRKSDLSNKTESIMDLLVDAGILEDDNWFICSDIRMVFGGVDKDKPRCEIEIEELE